jgi:adenylate cyclase class 2
MSGEVQEVEVKYRVLDRRALEAVLAARGVVLSEPVRQDDQAYAPEGWSYGQSKIGVPFARVRTQDGRHLFTVKVPRANEQACAENESVVADREQMHQAIIAMGFRPTVRIVKTRRSGRLELADRDVALCVDEVEHAGAFLELETMVTGGEGAAVQAVLHELAQSLGVELERTRDTYDSLVRAALTPA